jgi:hypothetical protein
MGAVSVFGRAWIYDDEPSEIAVWEHELEPMGSERRSGADWASEHLRECYSDKDLREMFDLPPSGDFQVLFRGTLDGGMTGYESPEWDEWFEVEESKHKAIPAEFKRWKNASLR